jgi:hypothetical protein
MSRVVVLRDLFVRDADDLDAAGSIGVDGRLGLLREDEVVACDFVRQVL